MTKPTLILVPGVLNTHELWRHQIQSFQDTYNIWVPETHHHKTIEQTVEDILGQAPSCFSLAGLSMGGYIALEIMRRASDRVVRLALLNTSARADTEESKLRRKSFIQLAKTGKFRGVTPRLLPTLVHAKSIEKDDIAECVYRMSADIGAEGFINQQLAVMAREDSLPILRGIKKRTLIIVGRQDTVTPLDLAIEMSRHIKRSEVHVIEECGHLSCLEQPERTTELMAEWLGLQV